MRGFIIKTGLEFEQTNKTGYDESRYKHLVCPICGTRFHRPPSHVARVKGIATCSRGCAAEAREVRVETNCVSCGKVMSQKPSDSIKITTCSKECSTLRRIKNIKAVKPSSLGGYLKAAKRIAKIETCHKCLGNTGPWVVRNLMASVRSTGETIVDESSAELWCRSCHLIEVAPKGPPARIKKHGR